MKRFGLKYYSHVPDPKKLKFKNYKSVLKAIGAVSNIANSLLDIKSNKLRYYVIKALRCKAILSHVNSEIKQNRRENIVNCLENRYRRLSRNVLPDSKELFGDDITK